jgi:hypothetical protein
MVVSNSWKCRYPQSIHDMILLTIRFRVEGGILTPDIIKDRHTIEMIVLMFGTYIVQISYFEKTPVFNTEQFLFPMGYIRDSKK